MSNVHVGDRVRVAVSPSPAAPLGAEGRVVGDLGPDQFVVVLDGYDEPYHPIAAMILESVGLPANARPLEVGELEVLEHAPGESESPAEARAA